MIALLFPKTDFEAVNIAVKVDALVENKPIYIVPKYPWRKENLVYKKLNDTQIAFFLASSNDHKIDELTENELKFLLDRGIDVFAMVPKGYSLKNFKDKLYVIEYESEDQLLEELRKVIGKQIEREKTEEFILETILTLGMIIGGLFLLNKLIETQERK